MHILTISGNLTLILLSTAFDDCSCANVYVHTYIRILTTEPESGTEHRMSYFMPSFYKTSFYLALIYLRQPTI